MIDISEHAPEVLRQAEHLVEAIRHYERAVAPTDYAPTLENQLLFGTLAPPALALENALSRCGFSADAFPPTGQFPGYMRELICIHSLCRQIRFSRHARSQKEKAEVAEKWGIQANGGWGIVPRKVKTLPKMGGHADRLAVYVERLQAESKGADAHRPILGSGKTPQPRPQWDRASRILTVDNQPVEIAKREAHVQFAILDLLEEAGWPTQGVLVPRTFSGSIKDAVDALNERLSSTSLTILRLHNNQRIGWKLDPN